MNEEGAIKGEINLMLNIKMLSEETFSQTRMAGNFIYSYSLSHNETRWWQRAGGWW
jgi:hypothetical protein